jgi:arylsulfatase A-like enzyme
MSLLDLARLSLIMAMPLGLVACGEDPSPLSSKPPLVLWIEVDTLRADVLGCYGAGLLAGDLDEFVSPTPNLDRLAQEGLLFEAAYSTAPWTLPSLASALTGKWPWEHGTTRLLASLASGHVTLPERLQSAGFRTGGVMTNFVATEAYGFAQGFDEWDDSLAMGHEGSTASAAAIKMLEQYDGLAIAGEPVFLFGLFFEPHWRYEAHVGSVFDVSSEGAASATEDIWDLRTALDNGELSDADLRDLRMLYAGEVAKVDAAIGLLFDGLKERGAWDDALVLFTADHGELVGERDWIGHTVTLTDELVRVPMILRVPLGGGTLRAGESFAIPVSQVDLHSTLMELAGAPVDKGLAITSRSFASLLFDESHGAVREDLFLHVDFEPHATSEKARGKRTLQWGVVKASDGTKWTVDHLSEGGPKGVLVNTANDADEAQDLSGEKTELELAEYWRLQGLVPRALGEVRGGQPR